MIIQWHQRSETGLLVFIICYADCLCSWSKVMYLFMFSVLFVIASRFSVSICSSLSPLVHNHCVCRSP
uniref:Uncharacterized protein n=1 Tax=Anguilla anguilla TaxID=7936 RepID=A0A0E9WY62_ANGAN